MSRNNVFLFHVLLISLAVCTPMESKWSRPPKSIVLAMANENFRSCALIIPMKTSFSMQ